MSRFILYKSAKIVPLLETATGDALFAPVKQLDNGELLVCNNKIEAIGNHLRVPLHCEIRDLGDVTILPAFVNSHAHLQLSWLAGGTIWKQGFVPWLKSMVPQILGVNFGIAQQKAVARAFVELAHSGTAIVGDIGGSIAGAIRAINSHARKNMIAVSHFCEWIGFNMTDASPWPPRSRQDLEAESAITAAPCGHALYSTSPDIMRKAHCWCKSHGRIFTFHLSESPEETEMLVNGRGDLADFYTSCLLPDNWKAPGLTPAQYAARLGLLERGTLAVHGVTMTRRELADFAATGAALCICARSNANLGVGLPAVRAAAEAGILLCLGTDGLTSCADLDLRNETLYIQKNLDMPLNALWRMASANGAAALGYPAPNLLPGSPARFTIWRDVVPNR